MIHTAEQAHEEVSRSSRKTGFGPGMPAALYLEQFGSYVWDAFGEPPFLVGSATTGKAWRDIDVRLILDDDEYHRLFGGKHPCEWRQDADEHLNGKWVALCLAFSELGKAVTGLPIDFQIQSRTKANELYPGPRHALGLISLRLAR